MSWSIPVRKASSGTGYLVNSARVWAAVATLIVWFQKRSLESTPSMSYSLNLSKHEKLSATNSTALFPRITTAWLSVDTFPCMPMEDEFTTSITLLISTSSPDSAFVTSADEDFGSPATWARRCATSPRGGSSRSLASISSGVNLCRVMAPPYFYFA